MPPKKTPQPPTQIDHSIIDEDFAKLLDDLKQEYGTRFQAQGIRFDKLEESLREAKSEINNLKSALQKKEEEIVTIKQKANDQEQYIRSWSIRILDLTIPRDLDSSDTSVVMDQVYNQVLTPILRGAVSKGLLPSLPTPTQILETAHILPSKPGQTPPIIARFYSRNIKALIFRLKREFAKKQDPTPSQTTRPHTARPAHPFYEDLTTQNFRKMRSIAADPRVLACWSVAGQLRLRLNNSDTVHKVHNIYETTDTIITKATSTSSTTTSTKPQRNNHASATIATISTIT